MYKKDFEVKQITVETLEELRKELDSISEKEQNVLSINAVILLSVPLCDSQHSV